MKYTPSFGLNLENGEDTQKKELSPRSNKAPAASIYKIQGNLSSTGQMMIGPALVSGFQFKIIPQQVKPSRHKPRIISPVKKAR